jgi:3-dehydroquinate dehydratase, type II
MKILVINGPNMNMLGLREPEIYGNRTYSDLKDYISRTCEKLGIECSFFQSNHEGAIIDAIQESYGTADGIVINPAGYTHTSIAIMDALKSVPVPAIEVHLSDISSREEFRKTSYCALACRETVAGYGFESYSIAIEELKKIIEENC